MNPLKSFAEYHARLALIYRDIDEAIGDCPIDPEDSPGSRINQEPRRRLGLALSAVEDAMDCIGHTIQTMQEAEKEAEAVA